MLENKFLSQVILEALQIPTSFKSPFSFLLKEAHTSMRRFSSAYVGFLSCGKLGKLGFRDCAEQWDSCAV
eukprot:856614-Pelagomonas_calceolata.AAC.3